MPMQVFTVGQVLAAADVNEYLVNTRFAVKPIDTSRPSTTTLAADPDLTLPVDANKSYYLQANLLFTAPGPSTGDLKYTWAIPASTVFTGTAMFLTSGVTVGLQAYQTSGIVITGTSSALGNGPTIQPLVFSGVLTTAGTSGNLTFSWAQQTSNATPTVLKQSSSLFLRRVS